MNGTKTTWRLLVGSIVVSIGVGSASGYASAADTAFINRMADQYTSFHDKHRNLYNQYVQEETHQYDTYRSQMTSVYDELLRLARADLADMTAQLENDLRQLKLTYKENSDAYRSYARAADKDRASEPMDLYEDTMDPDNAGSPMDMFEDQLDPDSAGDAMDLYADALDPDMAGSIIDLYEDDVDPDSAGNVMDVFEDESSIHSAGSIMDRYEDGGLTKEEAEKRMAEALAKAEADMNKRIADTERALQARKNESLRDIRDAWLNAKNSILQQREKTIADLSAARKELTGTGIAFKPLVLNDWITVVVDGDYMIFEQPPVIVNGNTLVPLRAIFEKLGAEVLWNDTDKSVTASKGSATVWLQIDNAAAKIKGKDQSLEVAPTMMNGSTMVPLRFVSEALGANVQWDDSRKTVTISSAS
ncbi:stalk domain-containing protein [Paenibacillus sp. GYB003]|uniref:stalk domain-containing protein n=1 Tax=Paenibacillus sp. GYB003 TaxID=2994392 RepID=UPI002F965BC3